MKCDCWPAFDTQILSATKRLSSRTKSTCSGWFMPDTSIIMEYADDGDLFQKIVEHKKRKIYIDEKKVWKVAIQMLSGIKTLHEMNILHRDLKSANVFLYKDGTAKIGDMNVSKIAKKGLLYTQTGTPYYASPEVWNDNPYDHK